MILLSGSNGSLDFYNAIVKDSIAAQEECLKTIDAYSDAYADDTDLPFFRMRLSVEETPKYPVVKKLMISIG